MGVEMTVELEGRRCGMGRKDNEDLDDEERGYDVGYGIE